MARLIKKLIIVFFVGGIGGWIVPSFILPYFGITANNPPILITRREEIHIDEGVNAQEVADRVKESLVTVYTHEGDLGSIRFRIQSAVPGTIVASDGIIAVPAEAIRSDSVIRVGLSDGTTVSGKFIASDSFTGLAFVRIEKNNLPVVKQGFSAGMAAGEKVLVVSKDSVRDIAVATASLVRRGELHPSFDAVLSLGRPNVTLELDRGSEIGRAGALVLNKDAAVVGYIASSAKAPTLLRSEDFSAVINNFLDDQKIIWPSLKLSYNVLGTSEASLLGLPARFGFLIKSAGGVLREGDFVYAADGNELTASSGLQQYLFAKKPGDKVKLKLIRLGKELEMELTL